MYTFFGLTPAYKVHVHEMILSVMYACNGFSFSDVYNMPVWLRKFYLKKLSEWKKEEAGKGSEQSKDNVADNMQKIKSMQRTMQQKFSAKS